MPTITTNSITTVTITQGCILSGSGSCNLIYGPGSMMGQSMEMSGQFSIGPFQRDQAVTLSAKSQLTYSVDNPKNPTLSPNDAAVDRSVVPAGGLYMGAAFPKKSRLGSYGRKVASWSAALQNSAGTATLVTGDLPPVPDNATQVLQLTQNATASFGQQNPVDGGQGYIPKGKTPGFTVGIWVRNPNTRTLNFEVQFYNVGAARNIRWNCACEPTGSNWRFITLSPNQLINGTGWTFGTDAVSFVRITQKDNGPEGAWLPGEYMRFSNVYVDVAARPRLLPTFDDGYASQSAMSPASFNRVSGGAGITSTASNVLTTATAHGLFVGEPMTITEVTTTTGTLGLTIGTTYYVQTIPASNTLTLASDAALQNVVTTTGWSGSCKYQYGGTQARSSQEIAESYGMRGTLFIVPLWLGTSGKFGYGGGVNKFMTTEALLSMWNDGWSVGSHSNTHPSNNENAGLRLLGPYGYYLSNTFDNMPAQYKTNWGLTTTTGRRRVISGTQASPSVFTTENAHQFLSNMPIVFTDVAPTGCQLGVTYYVKVMSGTTFSLARDQGSLLDAVNNTTGAWSGLANYRFAGSAPDDTAIYADLIAAIDALAALGIPTGGSFFALPQGGSDEYVRSACIRSGIKWIRGINGALTMHTIPIGSPSGGSNLPNWNGGYISQLDAIQTDGSLSLPAIDTYINECVTQGACGCSYHHDLSSATLPGLDRFFQTAAALRDAGKLDVLTADEYIKELGLE